MPTLYIATLGQRPEALTVAFDRLCEQHHYDALAVLHTDAKRSGIAQAYTDLRRVLEADYPALRAQFHEMTHINGTPLTDIDDQRSAEAYHRGVLEVLYGYRNDGWNIHLMLAGGRKAMSIYAMLAASALFQPPRDLVWTVLSPEAMIAKPGQFHIPPGMRDQVQLVELPLRPARVAPGTAVEVLLEQPPTRAQAFLAKLTPAEREITDLLRLHPYDSNEQLGQKHGKSHRTIENQLSTIYDKMIGFLEYGENITNKRQALLDILREE